MPFLEAFDRIAASPTITCSKELKIKKNVLTLLSPKITSVIQNKLTQNQIDNQVNYITELIACTHRLKLDL